MSGKLEAIKEITLSDEKLFPNVESLTGMEEQQSAGGFTIRATKTGKVVSYSATDSTGAALPGYYLQMTDGAPHISTFQSCFYCVTTGGATYCTEVLCPDPPDKQKT